MRERSRLRQVTVAAVGILDRIDDDDELPAQFPCSLVLAGDQPVGHGRSGVDAAQLVAVDAVGDPRDGLGAVDCRRVVPGGATARVDAADVRLAKSVQPGDRRLVADEERDELAPLVGVRVGAHLGAWGGRGQRLEITHRLAVGQRARTGVESDDFLLRRDRGVEFGPRKKCPGRDALHLHVGRGRSPGEQTDTDPTQQSTPHVETPVEMDRPILTPVTRGSHRERKTYG